MQRKNMKIKMIILVFSCAILSGCGHYRSITGTVIDAETLKPIEGAVVMVEWTKQVGFGEYHTESVKVIEAVTDKNGRVSLEGIFNPLVDPPDVAVYKPGYVTWSSRTIFPSNKNREDFRWEDYTFKLEQFRPEYSYVEHGSFFSFAINSTIGINKNKLIRETFDDWEKAKRIEERNKVDEMRKRSEGGRK
jgi:hypothetical protein